MTEEAEEARTKIRAALGPAEADPGLRARVIASMPIEPGGGSRRLWAAGGVAVLLSVMIVAGLVFVRQRTPAQPAAAGHLIGSLNMTTQLDFRCSLPVQAYLSEARISLPDGGVTVDQVQTQGKGSPVYGSVYVNGKWLPVPRAWLSSDGRSYAYVTSTSGVPGQAQTAAVYVHDVARGTDRKLWSGTGYTQMIGWGPGGVYFAFQSMDAGKGPSLATEVWVVDPASPGAAHRVGPNPPLPAQAPNEAIMPLFQFGTRIAGGAAWTVKQGAPQAPIPAAGGSIVLAPSQVLRMDLRDGSLSTWFTAPDGTNLSIAGTDQQGHPILVISTNPKAFMTPPSAGPAVKVPPEVMYPPPPRVLLLTGANQTLEISSGSDSGFRPTSASGDTHGIWFASPGTLWLYHHGSLARVADIPASLFPLPTPPPNAPTPPPNYTKPTPPPGYPIGVSLSLLGPCV